MYALLLKINDKTTKKHCFQAGGSSALLMDLAAQEKSVHADFFNGKLLHKCLHF